MSLKVRSCWAVNIRMVTVEELCLEAIGRFVTGSEDIRFEGQDGAQVTRLIGRYTASGRVEATVYRRRRFPQLYTQADIELLASVDEAHKTLSGAATRRILEREHHV